MKLRFYLLRAKLLALIIRLFGFLLVVDLPPISSSAAIVVRDKKILVVKLTYRNGYSLPGGLVQSPENSEETLKREVEEETGLKVVSFKYFGSFAADGEMPSVNTTYIANVTGELRSSDEGKAFWKKPENIIKYLVYKDNIQAVKKYFNLK